MRLSKVLIPTVLAVGALSYATLGLASVATAETSVTGEADRPTCYVLGHAPIASVNLMVSLGEC